MLELHSDEQIKKDPTELKLQKARAPGEEEMQPPPQVK
jgi:hypothetical protein